MCGGEELNSFQPGEAAIDPSPSLPRLVLASASESKPPDLASFDTRATGRRGLDHTFHTSDDQECIVVSWRSTARRRIAHNSVMELAV